MVNGFRLSLRRISQMRSEEHTSELQSQSNLVCRLLLEKKKNLTRRDEFVYLAAIMLLFFDLGVASLYLNFFDRILGYRGLALDAVGVAQAIGVVAMAVV